MSAIDASLPSVRARALSPRVVLTAIVALSAAAEMLVAGGRETPSTFPDEYLYSGLARSLAHGSLRIHGVAAHFPALLVPVLTSPAWLLGAVATSFRLVQLENAVVMSTAAIPAYLLARRLGARANLGYGVAALTVCSTPMFTVPVLETEPFAYPLSLFFVLAAVDAIERPSRRCETIFLALAVAVALTRVQLAVLPLAVALTMVVVSVRNRRVRAMCREHALFLAGIALVLAYVPFALTGGVGFYHHAGPQGAGLGQAFGTMAVEGYVMAIAAGMAIVPAALVGYGLALAKPRTRIEGTFGVLVVAIAGALLLETVFWSDASLIHERYLCYLVPLFALGFVLRVTRAERRKLPEAAIAAALAAAASVVQLGGHAIDSFHRDSPVLKAFARLALSIGNTSTSTVFAIGVTALVAVGVAASTRRGAPIVLAVSIAATLWLLVGANALAGTLNRESRANYLPTDAQWVDHTVHGKATLVVTPFAAQGTALATLFWNPSLDRVVLLQGAMSPDRLNDPAVVVRANGTLVSEGAPLTAPLLTDGSVTSLAFRNATPVKQWSNETVWQPHGAAALAAEVIGRSPVGQVLPRGLLRVWSPTGRVRGRVELRISTPRTGKTSELSVGGHTVTTAPGQTRTLSLRVCTNGPWTAGFLAGPGAATPIVSMPRYVADPTACP